ncbi:MAG: hypothetical protein RR517_06455 [Pseudomonas sp.]
MEIKEYKPEDTSKKVRHLTMGAQTLVLRIDALIALIPSDIVRATVSALLGDAIKTSDERLLRQLLIVAQTSIESSKLVESKINNGDFKYNVFTGELLSELDYTQAVKQVEDFMTKKDDKVEPKNSPKQKI